MGIPTDPAEYSYGPNCACWSPGLTPTTIYAYASGIKIGSGWVPALGPPANGLHVLPQSATPCLFTAPGNGNPNSYHTHMPGTLFRLSALIGFCFVTTDPADCIFFIENGMADPAGPFYGGIAIIFQKEPFSGGAPSLADIAELLNIDGRPSRKSEIFPLDSSHLVAMFADKVESTRIRIKYDFT